MKKLSLLSIVVIMVLCLFAVFPLSGCKTEQAAETTAAAAETTAAATTAAGETTAAAETPEEVEVLPAMDINIWDWQPGENYVEAMKNNIEAFKAKYPQYANINFIHTVLGNDYWTVLRASLMAKEDVADSFGILQDANDLYDYMVDFRPLIEGDPEWSAQYSFVDSPDLSTNGMDQRVTGIAIDRWVAGVYYYKDILAKYNIPEPVTIDDYIAMAPILAKDNINVLSMGGDAWVIVFFYYNMAQSLTDITNMAGIVKDAYVGDLRWDDPIFKTALTEFKKLYDGGVFREDELSLGQFAEAIQNFQAKKSLGFWMGGTWWAGSMNAEDLAAGNVGILPVPVPKGGTPTFEQSTGQPYGIYKDAPEEKQKVLIDFLKFLSSPEAVSIYLKNNVMPAGNIPEGVDIPNSLIKESLEKVKTVRAFDPHNWEPESTQVYGDAITNVFLNNSTIDEALKTMEDLAAARLSK